MSAKDDCFKLIQQIAIARDKVCQHPDCCTSVEVGHHIFSRSRMATAFLPEAVIGLCAWHHSTWAHGKPKAFKEFMVERIGERYHQLRRRSYETVKNPDYNEIRQGLVKVLEAYQHGA
jgi:hypothetical protein